MAILKILSFYANKRNFENANYLKPDFDKLSQILFISHGYCRFYKDFIECENNNKLIMW